MATGPWGVGGVEPIRIIIKMAVLTNTMQVGFKLRALPPSAASELDAANHVVTNILPAMKGALLLQTSLISVSAINMATDVGAEVPLNAQAGTVSGSPEPLFLEVPINFKSGLRRRTGQGRMLFPVQPTAFVTGDQLSTQGAQLIDAVATALATNYTGQGIGNPWQLVNAHELLPASRPHKRPEPLPEVPATYYDVVSVRANHNVSALHRRKAGVGS